jgi:hypothetical protein
VIKLCRNLKRKIKKNGEEFQKDEFNLKRKIGNGKMD